MDGQTLCSFSQSDSVAEYLSQHPQLRLSLDSFSFDR
jgi:hypothetical protein